MRSRSLFVPLLAVLAVAVVAPPEGRAAGTANAAEAKGERVVVSPRAGRVVRSHHVRLRVRSRGLSGVLRARLNGVPVGNHFSRPRRGVRTLRASLSHGLRHGRNVLRVSVRRRGRAPRRATVRFFVRTGRPLVGAGKNRRVVIGSTARLKGQVKHATRRTAGSKLRWKLVGGPRRGRAAAAGARARSVTLTSTAGLNAGFRAVAPGSYTLQLASGAGQSATTDRVTVDAVPPSPLVPVDTMPAVSGDQRGIRVGDTTYLLRDATGGGQRTYLQVLTLKRDTLGFVWNRKYDSASALRDDLGGLDERHLVILVQQPDSDDASPGANIGELNDVVGRIGVPDYVRLPKGRGAVSAIGVPGLARGDADVNVVPNETTYRGRRGRMTGYLTPDQYLNYGYVASQREPFSYGAKEVAPCGAGDPPDRCGDNVGYRLSVMDSRTLEPRSGDNRVYSTNGRGLTAAQVTAEANRMADDLNAVASEDVVIIQTVSTRREGEASYRPPVGPVNWETMKKLSLAVAKVGGTRDAFNRTTFVAGAPASGGATYMLVGWAGAREGEGAESAAGRVWPGEHGRDRAGDAPMLGGVLRPDRESRFRPAQVMSSGRNTDALAAVMLAPPTTAWPLDDDPGAQAAIAFLASKDDRIGSDPRSAYWTQGWGESTTNSIIGNLERVTYPAGREFTPAQFDAAKDQLIEELRWVGNVRTYLTKLASPFADNALKSWVAAQTIADKIYEAARRPQDEAAFKWIELTEAILHLFGPATHEISAAVASAMEIGVWIAGATNEGAPTGDEVRAKANELGAHLVEQAEQAVATYDRMGDIIVSDYAKLKYIGPKGGCKLSAPGGCPKELAFSDADRIAASADVYRGIEKVAYLKLLPLEFRVMALTRELMPFRPVPPDVKTYECGGYHPWYAYADLKRDSASLLQEVDPAGWAHGWESFVLSAKSATDRHGTPPSDEILTRMFDPVSQDGDPRKGGLGISWRQLATGTKLDHWYGTKGKEAYFCQWTKQR